MYHLDVPLESPRRFDSVFLEQDVPRDFPQRVTDVPLEFPKCLDRLYHLCFLSVLTGCTNCVS